MPEDRVRQLVERAHRGPLPRPARRAARERAGAQPGAGSRRATLGMAAACEPEQPDAAMADQRRDLDQRPSPEALLDAARREESRAGRLKIFVGAAPGVGKTYEMLQTARAEAKDGVRRRRRRGRDARPQGDRGAARRPRGPPAQAASSTRAVARASSTSTPSSRAGRRSSWSTSSPTPTRPAAAIPKRYLDVEELLDAGIDVYTTVNIQHIESLNDVVAQITRVRVRETVPDSIFDRADAVELVDLTPDDLIQRLKEGKVYVPKQAERALKHYFSPANLTALRELALRRTAERVDEQLLDADAGARHPGAVGGGRAHSRLRQRGSALRRPGALRQAPGRPPARPLDRALRRDRRSLQLERGAARPHRRHAAAGRARSDGEAVTVPGGDAAHRRRRHRLRASNNVTHIIIGKSDALALVRDPARLGRARPGAPRRQHQRARHRRRGARGGADPAEDASAPRTRSQPFDPLPYVVAAARRCRRARRRPADPAAGSASRTSTSSS